jgi:hypothetical protein
VPQSKQPNDAESFSMVTAAYPRATSRGSWQERPRANDNMPLPWTTGDGTQASHSCAQPPAPAGGGMSTDVLLCQQQLGSTPCVMLLVQHSAWRGNWSTGVRARVQHATHLGDMPAICSNSHAVAGQAHRQIVVQCSSSLSPVQPLRMRENKAHAQRQPPSRQQQSGMPPQNERVNCLLHVDDNASIASCPV